MFGSVKENPILKEFLTYYADRPFILPDGTYDLKPNPFPITETCVKHGLVLNGNKQQFDFITIYPKEYFCPYNRATEELGITENTYTIHYFNGAWIDDEKKKIINKRKQIVQKHGKLAGYIYYGVGVWRTEGFGKAMKEFVLMMKQ